MVPPLDAGGGADHLPRSRRIMWRWNMWKGLLDGRAVSAARIVVFVVAAVAYPTSPYVASLILALNLGVTIFSYVLTPFVHLPSLWPFDDPSSTSSSRKVDDDDEVSCGVCGKGACARHRADLDPATIQPWLGLLLHARVDEALEEIGELLLRDSVQPWYQEVSSDPDFVDELRAILRHVVAIAIRRLTKTAWSPFILRDLVKEGVRHLGNFVDARSRSSGPGRQEEGSPKRDVQLSALSRLGNYMHTAVRSRESEIKYLTNLVDSLLPLLLPRAAKDNRCVNALVREILVTKCVLPLMDVLADPDVLNYLAIVILDKDPPPVFTGDPSSKTTILTRFSSPRQNQAHITTLRYSLDQVMDNPSLLYYFMQFLKSEASVHVLQFCTTVQELNTHLLNPDLSVEDSTTLHRDARALYEGFIAVDAVNRIAFDEDIVEEVRRIVEGPTEGIVGLRRTNALFRAYEHAYTDLLENTFLPLFHQSDHYFRMLCGEREVDRKNRPPSNLAATRRNLNHFVPKGGASRLGNRIRGVFKTVADEVDFVDTIEGGVEPTSLFDDADDEVEAADDFDFGRGSSSHDLSTWRVTIPSVAEAPSAEDSNKFECILNIEVHRVDCCDSDTIPQHWEVGRKYEEFHVLQSKLAEFHGELEGCRLSAKKAFGTKDLDFIERSRSELESFLQSLLLQPTLKNSQLLRTFLSADVEGNPFASSVFPEINIGKVFRKVPSKLIKEKGQHLNAFLHSFAYSTDINSSQVLLPSRSNVTHPGLASRQMSRAGSSTSLNSLSAKDSKESKEAKDSKDSGEPWTKSSLSADTQSDSPPPRFSSHPLFGNLADIPDSCFPPPPLRFRSANLHPRSPSSTVDSREPESPVDFVLFCCRRVFRLPRLLMTILHGAELLARRTLEAFLVWFLSKKLDQIMEERRMEDILHDLRDVLFFDEDPPRTTRMKNERRERLFKEMIHFLPSWVSAIVGNNRIYEGWKVVFDCLQRPVLNKQLVYCLLDIALAQVFPELNSRFQEEEVVADL